MKYKDIVKYLIKNNLKNESGMMAGGIDSAFSYGDTPVNSGQYGNSVGNQSNAYTGHYPVDPKKLVLGSKRNKKKNQRLKKTIKNKMNYITRPAIPNIILNSFGQDIIDDKVILECCIITKNPQYDFILKQLLESSNISYKINELDDRTLTFFSEKDDNIEQIINKFNEITHNPQDIGVLIFEQSIEE